MNEIKEAISKLKINEFVINYLDLFINTQQLSLSQTCPDIKKVNTEYLIKASNELVNINGRKTIDEIYNVILSKRPHQHLYFNRDIVKFFVILMWYGFFNDDVVLAKAALSFGFYSFSYNYKIYFRFCNPEIMSATIEELHGRSLLRKYKDFVTVIKYIVADNINTYLKKRKPHEWVMFQLLINLNNRIKLMLRKLANVYHNVAKEMISASKDSADNNEYIKSLSDTGLDTLNIVQNMKLNIDSIQGSLNDSALNKISKRIGIDKKVMENIINKITSDSTLKNMFLRLSAYMTSILISDKGIVKKEKDFCIHKNKIVRYLSNMNTYSKYDNLQTDTTRIYTYMKNKYSDISVDIKTLYKVLVEMYGILSYITFCH